MKREESGFTLIELMVVVVIITVIALFVLPAYQNYTMRTRVSEGIAMASEAQIAISSYRAKHNQSLGDIQRSLNLNNVYNLADPNKINSKSVESITIRGPMSYPNAIGDGVRIAYRADVIAGEGATRIVDLYYAKKSGEAGGWQCISNLSASILPNDCLSGQLRDPK